MEIYSARCEPSRDIMAEPDCYMATALISMTWFPLVEAIDRKLTYSTLQRLQSYIAPSLSAVFLTGIIFPRVTKLSAISSLILGATLAILRFILDAVYPLPNCGDVDSRPFLARISFLHFSSAIFFICLLCICVVSVFTEPVPLNML